MKIIAIGNKNVILEATVREVNMLAGKVLYDWSNYHNRWLKYTAPGTIFNVIDGISQLHRNAKRVEEIQHLKQQLQSIILQLDLVEPFMKEPDPDPEVELTGEPV